LKLSIFCTEYQTRSGKLLEYGYPFLVQEFQNHDPMGRHIAACIERELFPLPRPHPCIELPIELPELIFIE